MLKSSEIELINRAKRAEKSAFEELYLIFSSDVFNFANSMVKNYDDAQEIVQEVFIKVINNISSLLVVETFKTWIMTITRNECLNYLNKRNKSQGLRLSCESQTQEMFICNNVPSNENPISILVLKNDLSENLMKFIENLSMVQKETVLLYYFKDMKINEIAKIMSCSEGTVKTRLYLARASLKVQIEAADEEMKTSYFI